MNKEDDQPAPLAALSDAQAIDYLMRVLLRVEGRASALTSTHLVPMVRTINTLFKNLAKKHSSVAMLKLDLQRQEAFQAYRETTLKNLQEEKKQRAAVRGDAESVSDLSEFESPGDAPRLAEGSEAPDLQPKELNLELEEDKEDLDQSARKRSRSGSQLSETHEARSRSR